MTTFNDMIKTKFLESFTNVSISGAVITMLLAFCLGLFIFYIYKNIYSGVMYSQSFGVTLIALTMITALVILAVTSNVILSLGMVGALSIVRFRTAIKDPLDIAFLFWSLVAGIVLAAGLYPLAVIGSIMIATVLLFFVNTKPYFAPYILVLQCENRAAEISAIEFVKHAVEKQTFGTMMTHNEKEVINQSMDSLLTGGDVSTRPMFGWIINDEKYRSMYHKYYQQFIFDMIDNGKIEQLITNTALMLKPYVEKDPSKFYFEETFETGISSLKKYFVLRTAKIKEELAGGNMEIATEGFSLTDMGAQDDE